MSGGSSSFSFVDFMISHKEGNVKIKFENKIKNIKLTNNLMFKRLKLNKITGARLESY